MQPVSSDAPAYPDESSAKIPKAPCGTVKRAFRAAFPHTLPILAGFLFLGFAYGLLMRTKGFSFLYPMCMAMTIFGGSLEYITVSMLLIFGLCDETFSITCSADVPPEVDRGWCYLWVTVLDWCYWVAGAAVLLHEFLSGRELFGCGIMLCAVILVQLPEGFWKRKIKANNE